MLPRSSKWLPWALVPLAGFVMTVNLAAQSPVREMRAQLAAGFNPVKGRLITAGDTIIFMDDAQPQSSFFANRAQIQQVSAGDADTLSIQFKQPVRDREGDRTRMEFRVSAEDRETLKTWFAQAAPATATTAATAPATAGSDRGASPPSGEFPTYSARRDKFLGGNNGQLVVKPDRLAFEAGNPDASREWLFSDIRELKQKGPYRLEIQPFSGDKYSLELLGGGGMAREDFQRIEENIARARSKR